MPPVKIHVLSDLHLEYADRHPSWTPPPTDADVVVLAGDIHNGTAGIDWAERVFAGKQVVYVAGNHEFYDGELSEVMAALRDRSANSANVWFLENDALVIGNVRFLGTTLWTDFELFGKERMQEAIEASLRHVVDFRAIRRGPDGRITPDDMLALHATALCFLAEQFAEPFEGPTVVVTHHGPHERSVHPRWAEDLTSAAFVSRLHSLVGTPALWIHGHTHDGFDYQANGTRVVANPMGYRKSGARLAGKVPEGVTVVFENGAFDPGRTVDV